MTKTINIFKCGLMAAAYPITAGILSLLLLGCKIQSADGVSRSVEQDYSGIYSHNSDDCPEQDDLINVRTDIDQLNLIQTGDQLEVITEHEDIFRGTIGTVVDGAATFTIEGETPGVKGAIITGTISGDGVMQATWITDSTFGIVCGSASGVSITFSITASSSAVNIGGSITLSTSTGESASWSQSGAGQGTFSSATGSSVTFEGTVNGSVTISASGENGGSDSITITVN